MDPLKEIIELFLILFVRYFLEWDHLSNSGHMLLTMYSKFAMRSHILVRMNILYFKHTREKNNFKNLKTFGFQVHVIPSSVYSKYFLQDACQGIFLGYVCHIDTFLFRMMRIWRELKLLLMQNLMTVLMIFLLTS